MRSGSPLTHTSVGGVSATGALVTVYPAALASFTVSAPAAVTAGSAFGVAITAKDQFGNTVTGKIDYRALG